MGRRTARQNFLPAAEKKLFGYILFIQILESWQVSHVRIFSMVKFETIYYQAFAQTYLK
jgi:hypothetical protein